MTPSKSVNFFLFCTGVGKPEFVSETECSYQFDWHTVYACNQDMSRSCKYTDQDGAVYDFSRYDL